MLSESGYGLQLFQNLMPVSFFMNLWYSVHNQEGLLELAKSKSNPPWEFELA